VVLPRGARQKYGSNSTYFRGTPLFVAYYRDQISRIYASSTAALVQNLAVFALEKIGKSSRSLSIVILKNSKKRNDSRHGTNRFSQGPPNTTHIWARDQFSVQTRAQILDITTPNFTWSTSRCAPAAQRASIRVIFVTTEILIKQKKIPAGLIVQQKSSPTRTHP
jgi:hypothetical protein